MTADHQERRRMSAPSVTSIGVVDSSIPSMPPRVVETRSRRLRVLEAERGEPSGARPQFQPKPPWIRMKMPTGEVFFDLKKRVAELGLHTVCESAPCPNIGECWNHKTATFMLLGDICTRRCGFCAVPKGRPQPIDFEEPERVAEAVATLGLKHAVVTSVNRDDDNVGGAKIFAETIRQVREQAPGC